MGTMNSGTGGLGGRVRDDGEMSCEVEVLCLDYIYIYMYSCLAHLDRG